MAQNPNDTRIIFELAQVYFTRQAYEKVVELLPRFNKLVYELAYFQYEKALQDLATRTEARQRLKFLEAAIPNKEDRFMNKGKAKAAGPCYQWIY